MPRLDESAHIDTFARDHLPPGDQWPVIDNWQLDYPQHLNAAVELLDRMVEQGFGPRSCLRSDQGVWS